MPLPLSTLLALAASMDRAALADELHAAPPEAAPPAIPPSAMCYEPLPPEGEPVHVCPVCGARTEWEGPQAELASLLIEQAREIQVFLPRPHPALTVELDATALCRHCRPDAWPALALVVRWTDGRTVRTEGVVSADASLLATLLAVSKNPAEGVDALSPPQAARARTLLGLPTPPGAAP